MAAMLVRNGMLSVMIYVASEGLLCRALVSEWAQATGAQQECGVGRAECTEVQTAVATKQHRVTIALDVYPVP